LWPIIGGRRAATCGWMWRLPRRTLRRLYGLGRRRCQGLRQMDVTRFSQVHVWIGHLFSLHGGSVGDQARKCVSHGSPRVQARTLMPVTCTCTCYMCMSCACACACASCTKSCVRSDAVYKRADVGIVAFGIQLVSVAFSFSVLCVDLFVSLDESNPSLSIAFNVLGFDSITSFLALMIVTSREDTNPDDNPLLKPR
jgi:hypothetical protein